VVDAPTLFLSPTPFPFYGSGEEASFPLFFIAHLFRGPRSLSPPGQVATSIVGVKIPFFFWSAFSPSPPRVGFSFFQAL